MNKKVMNALKYLFFFGTGVFFVWLSLRPILSNKKMLGEFKEALEHAHFWLLVPVFIILSASHLIRALRWRTLIEPMGYRPSVPNTFFAVMIGYLANLAVPRLGEVLKCTILAKYEDIPAEKIVGTIVAERAFDVLCLGIIFLLALCLQFDVVISSIAHIKDGAVSVNKTHSSNKVVITVAIFLIMLALVLWMFFSGKWKAFAKKATAVFAGIWEGLITARKLKHKTAFFTYSVSIWLLYILGTWLGLYATDGSGLGIKEAISCLALASIGMIVSPGGLGAYAYLLAIVLEENGVKYAIGAANGNLQWFAQFVIVLVVGCICLGLLPWYNKNKRLL